MPGGTERATLGHTLLPMLSSRTGFTSLLSDMEGRHHAFAQSLKPYKDDFTRSMASCLALKFPTLICETKLDGERMLVHIQRGKVTMHVSTVPYLRTRVLWYGSLCLRNSTFYYDGTACQCMCMCQRCGNATTFESFPHCYVGSVLSI
jgi:hypothetical protein